MPDYALTGKKGHGKSKNGVRIARNDYFARGLKVATNLDIFLEPLFGKFSKLTYVRLPDKPSSFDLLAAGHGNPDSYNEDLNGMLLLDELGTWLNSRDFGDKARSGMLDFLAHGRKYGWNAYYIMQNVLQVDKQLRESFIEYTVRHQRYDRVQIPFVGWILKALFGPRWGYLPRFHVGVSRLGVNPQDMVTDRTMFVGDELHAAYDTRQVFRPDYPHGTFSVLSPWHVSGRFLPAPPEHWFVRFKLWLKGGQRRAVLPRSRPSAEWLRVRDLCARLPTPEARMAAMARYSRSSIAKQGAQRAG
jgi:hypothetical protein